MKKIKIFPLFVAFLMLFSTQVFATTTAAQTTAETSEETEETEGTLILTYEEALELALSDMQAITDIEIAIRDLQIHRMFFRDEMRRIESGRGTLQMHAMENMLRDLSAGIDAMHDAQAMLEIATGTALSGVQTGIANIADPNSSPEQVMALQASLTGLFAMSAPSLGGQISSMQSQQAELRRELDRLNRPENRDEMRREVQRNLNEFDRQTEMLEMAINQAKLSVEMGLRALISGIADVDRFIEGFEAGMKIQEMSLNRMTVLHQVGMLSTHDLNTARHAFSQQKTQLENLERTRETLMKNLNHFLGQPLTQDTIIEFEREFHEVPEELEEHIETLISETITVRNLELEIERAIDARWVNSGVRTATIINARDRQLALNPNRITANLWSLEQSDEDEEIQKIRKRIALQEAVERAEANHEQTIRQMETNLLRAYSDLDALHAQYEAQIADHARALENLEVALTNFRLGLITQFEIEQARLFANALERDKEGILNQKWALAFRLENPILLQ